jgi:hypothetical protein
MGRQQEIGPELKKRPSLNWINLAQVRDKLLELVNTVMKHRSPQSVEFLLTI